MNGTDSKIDTPVARDSSHAVLARDLRRGQHARAARARVITDNIIELLDPRGDINPAMVPVLLRR